MVIAEAGTPVYYHRSLEFDFQKNSLSRAGKDNQDFRTTCQAGRVLSKLWSRKNIFSFINMKPSFWKPALWFKNVDYLQNLAKQCWITPFLTKKKKKRIYRGIGVCREGSWTLTLFKDYERAKTDTRFKAESRKMTPYSRKKQNYLLAWKGKLCFVSVTLDV